MTPLLHVQNVSKTFRGGSRGRTVTRALDRVSVTFPADRPTILAIAGESGSGKTTLARTILGFERPSEGAVSYRGRPLLSMSRAERRQFRREVQPIFQDPYQSFNPVHRVDHVLFAPLHRFGLASSGREADRLVREALEAVGLNPAETLGRFPYELSGGQRQRVMVTRALLTRPRLIVADEPVSMIDASLRATILGALRALRRSHEISIAYITHDLATAYQLAESIVIMYLGSIVEAGATESVIRAPSHPYTQLLVDSIPSPDPRRPWGEIPAGISEDGRRSSGCKFAPRCPAVMERCWSEPPPYFRLSDTAVAACFLHADRPQLPSEDISEVLSAVEERQSPPTAAAHASQ